MMNGNAMVQDIKVRYTKQASSCMIESHSKAISAVILRERY